MSLFILICEHFIFYSKIVKFGKTTASMRWMIMMIERYLLYYPWQGLFFRCDQILRKYVERLFPLCVHLNQKYRCIGFHTDVPICLCDWLNLMALKLNLRLFIFFLILFFFIFAELRNFDFEYYLFLLKWVSTRHSNWMLIDFISAKFDDLLFFACSFFWTKLIDRLHVNLLSSGYDH